MIVGTAGHVDHGKTSLVRALTGIDTDRLKEEKARGITIDLGFAYMPGPDGETIGFVDVPGHERLVRTMVAGAAGIDYALLVVAGDDGLMPQTREHLDVLDLLHLTRGLIVVTKCDRIDAERRASVAGKIQAAIAGTGMAGADMMFVSSTTGDGIDDLRQRLHEAARESHDRQTLFPDDGLFRMSVDRAFTLSGVGTIVTGTARAGRIRTNDEVTVLPGGLKARIRSLHTQNCEADEGHAGQRCALALSGTAINKAAVPRGAWICAGAEPSQTIRFDAEVRLLHSAARALGQWTPVHFHCGASDASARVIVLDEHPLQPGGIGLVQIVLDHPLPLRHNDLFVLRDQSAQHTIGGGLVLDPRAPLRKRRSPERHARLAALRAQDPAEALSNLLALDPGFEDLTTFADDWGLTSIQALALQSRPGLGALKAGATIFVHTDARWADLRSVIEACLATFHEENPELPGIAGEKLRLIMSPLLSKPLFGAIRDRLIAEKTIAIQGHWLRLPHHVAQLSAEDRRIEALMVPLIAEQRFRPPRARDLGTALGVPEASIRRACKALVRIGTFMEIAPDHFFLRETVVEMAEIAQDLSRQSPTRYFTAADFRDRMDNGRKVAIQILESFDRQGLTQRAGDLRRVVKAPELIFGRRSIP